MVVSPAVLSKGKKSTKTTANVSFSDEASTSSPVASTSKVPIAGGSDAGDAGDAQMDDEDEVEGDGEWQSRQSAAHPSAIADSAVSSKESGNTAEVVDNEDEDDDAVMIDSNTLLPPVGSASVGGAAGEDQGLLKFPALSAKEMQGKVETQTRKVSVRLHAFVLLYFIRIRSADTSNLAVHRYPAT